MKKHITTQQRSGKNEPNRFNTGTPLKYRKGLQLLILCLAFFSSRSIAQVGSWTQVTNFAPHFNEGVMLLLTDGTVLCKTSSGGTYGNTWDKLTPSSTGSYINGTWSTIAPMHDDRLYFSTQVLQDGRVYVAGGEYGTGGVKSEVYDPQANTWTMCPQIVTAHPISDANSELLPNGKVLQAVVDTFSARLNYIYNPTTNTYSPTGTCLRVNNEASWIKLPDQSILFIDNYGTTSERYIPSTGTWVNDATVPLSLYDAFGEEAGAAFLLPDGRGFFIGATNHTAYYTPSGTTAPGTWAAGPDIPSTQGAPDAAAAMMVNGKILITVSPVPTSANHFPPPAVFYEFNYLTNTFTSVGAPGGGTSLTGIPTFVTNMLCLPDGTVLYATQGDDTYYVYTPAGSPLTAGKPTIDSVIQASCSTYMITGKLFNGISEGAGYGDDWQMATNYPVIRITSGSNVYYANSNHWNRTDVMTGAALDTAYFTVPGGVTSGTTYSLFVTANGIASTARSFTPGPAAITPSSVSVCIGTPFTLSDATSGGVWSSSNTAIATVGSSTGIVTGAGTGTATISYSLGSCFATRVVSVDPAPSAITGGGSICAGSSFTLSDATSGGTWSSSNTAVGTIGSSTGIFAALSGGTTTVSYSMSAGCRATTVISVNSSPTAFTVTGGGPYCSGGSGVAVGLSSSSTGVNYQLYHGATLITTVAGTNSALNFGLQTLGGTYTVLAINTGTSCAKSMTGSASVSTSQTPNIYSITGGGTYCTGGAGVAVGLSFSEVGVSYQLYRGATAVGALTPGPGTPINFGTFTTTGTYSVIAAPGGLCQRTMTGIATISSAPPPTVFSMTGGGSYCSGGSGVSIGLSGSASGVNYQLYNGAALVATISGTGSALNFGTFTTTGTYSVVAANATTGCVANMSGTAAVSIVSAPGTITGTMTVCSGLTTTLSCTPSSGTWSSGNTAVATVTSASGVVTGVTSGTATITYSLGAGCFSTAEVTVSPAPDAGSITGTAVVCAGSTTTLSDAASGGVWSSGNTAVATVDGTGNVTGLTAGTATISYTVSGGCGSVSATMAVTVTTTTSAGTISGNAHLCLGTSSVLADGVGGGVWSSDDNTVATVGSSTGIVTSVALGTANITYSVTNSCGTATASVMVTVDLAADAGFIAGASTVCTGASTALSETATGGVWSSSNTAKATVTSGGIVTGIATGTATISYTVTNSCGSAVATQAITVNTTPSVSAITGSSSVNTGATITLADATSGGTWSTSNSNASVSSTGDVTGIAGGTTTVSYTITNGCGSATATKLITINVSLSSISGNTTVCAGTTSALTDSISGGTWSTSNTGVATIGITSGIVTGVSAGTATITYTTGSSFVTTDVTVYPNPASITGGTNVCVNATVTLGDATSGGSWSSNNTGIATIDATTGMVTGVAAGTTTVTYTLPTGCFRTLTFTVKPLPVAIAGSTTICVGSATTLSDVTTVGVSWTSDNTSVATIGVSTGLLTGVSTGTANITYLINTGCMISTTVSVNAVPSAITGTMSTCVGATTTLTSATSGGSWSSSNANATVDASGIVTGVTAGTSTITYSLGTGCTATAAVTVNPLPAAITGTTTVCLGSTTTLSDATSGGTWNSSDPSIASITSGGIVTGNATGTVTISYTSVLGCSQMTTVTVSTGVASISGNASLCIGSTSALTDATSGGTWSSSNTAIATVTSGGVVTGVTAGTANITYTVSAGCKNMLTVTVSTSAAAITGSSTVCFGSTSTLSTTNTGGTWSSSNTAVATVDASGVVSSVATGTTVISYTLASGCYATKVMTVKPLPAAITGTASICIGATATLSDGTSGGVSWTSSNMSVATIGSSSGVVTGVAAGTSAITYTVNTGCYITRDVTVNTLPSSITGTMTVCPGSTTSLTSATTGGTWSSSNAAVASVGTDGTVTGVAAGVANISYSIGAGCTVTASITVNPLPAVITGTTTICQGSTSTLMDATSGGAWSSSDPSTASVSGGGVVTGVLAGAATITYTLGTGCARTAAFTVTSPASSITGTATLCVGSTTALSDATTGGTWSSSATSVATVNSSGVVTGVTTGNATITYTVSVGCVATISVTVNTALTANTGTAVVAVGNTTTLSNATSGGTWSSSNSAVGTIDAASGVVTGIAVGTTRITYTAGGCTTNTVVTVSAAIASITGNLAVCVGSTSTLTDASSPGVSWTSSNTSVATIGSSSGIVTGVSAGTSTITYTATGGLTTTAVVSVSAMQPAITGANVVCVGSTITKADATGGGVWSSSNAAFATVDAGGVVTGVASSVITITYNVGGCIRTSPVSVNPLPAAISGAVPVCIGSTAALFDGTTGGTWSSSTPAVATVGSTGIVSGVSAGATTITYTVTSTGCFRTQAITVSSSTANVGGPGLCTGIATTFTNATTGGTWSSSNTAVATIVSATGVATGIAVGTANITYNIGSSCKIITNATVTASPAAMTASNVCIGATSTLTNTTPGGTWSSSNVSLATIVSGTGVATGVAAGTATITYTLVSTGCYKTVALTIKALPGPISGTAVVCVGSTTTLSDGTGSSWSSSTPSVGTIGLTSGVVTGISAGTTTITFTGTVANGSCISTRVATVSAAASAGSISGPASVSVAASIITPAAYTDGIGGGIWTSSNTSIATIVGATGQLTGVAAGAINVTYTVNNGCGSAFTTFGVTITTPRAGGNVAPGVDEHVSGIQLYPNPTTGTFNISSENAGTLTVFTLDGKVLTQYDIASGITSISLPKGTAAGNYMCRFEGIDGSTATIQLVYKQ